MEEADNVGQLTFAHNHFNKLNSVTVPCFLLRLLYFDFQLKAADEL